MTKTDENWERVAFKSNKVWVAVDDNKKPVVKNGKVLIKYQLNQDYEYLVHNNSNPTSGTQSMTACQQMFFLSQLFWIGNKRCYAFP